ncbi:hypothetical protein [Paenibacillus sp. P3E]|uniref:hypothetical protein n=1 Tax=Paenibacillus sp. P3E TaxID=1349435 RepID=UPI000B13DC21|nr:hypothetical protein [Paenibacillus sp. P3E]
MNLRYTFDDMKKVDRSQLGDMVPLELFRTIRLIGLNQGLPLGGKGTTLTIGRKIGESLPATSVEELIMLFEDLKIGLPRIVHSDEHKINIQSRIASAKVYPPLLRKK